MPQWMKLRIAWGVFGITTAAAILFNNPELITVENWAALGSWVMGMYFFVGAINPPPTMRDSVLHLIRELNARGFAVLGSDDNGEWCVYAADGKRTIYANLRELERFAAAQGIEGALTDHVHYDVQRLMLFLGAASFLMIMVILTAMGA